MTIVRTSLALAAAAPLAFASTALAQSRRPMTFEDFAAMKAVSDPQLSPDGTAMLYAVRTTDVDANRRATTTYAMALGGGTARAFPDDTTRATEARWSPDGRLVAYTASGQLLRRIHSGSMNAGRHAFTWDGSNEKSVPAVAGVYFIRAEALGTSATKRVTLLR